MVVVVAEHARGLVVEDISASIDLAQRDARHRKAPLRPAHVPQVAAGAELGGGEHGPVCAALYGCLRCCLFHNQRPAMEQPGEYANNEVVETRWAFMRLAYELLLRLLHFQTPKISDAAFEHLIDEEMTRKIESGLGSIKD